jgi:hypothetical protein
MKPPRLPRSFKHFLHSVGKLLGGTGEGDAVSGGSSQSVLIELVALDFRVFAMLLGQQVDETDRRCIRGDDALL